MSHGANGRLDDELEAFVTEAGALIESPAFDARVVAAAGDGWRAEAWLDPETFVLDFVAPGPKARERLDDYQLALIYGLGFDDAEDGGLPRFRQEYEYAPGDEWEDQALRELALLAFGALRDILRESDAASYRVERLPRPAA